MKKKVWISKAALLLDQERLVPHATRSTATLLQAALRMSPGPSQDHATPRLANKEQIKKEHAVRFYLAEDSPHPSFRYKSSPAHSQISCIRNFRNPFSCKNPWIQDLHPCLRTMKLRNPARPDKDAFDAASTTFSNAPKISTFLPATTGHGRKLE